MAITPSPFRASATACIGLVVLAGLCAAGLLVRYDVRHAAGDIEVPQLRVLADTDATQAIGAEIADTVAGTDTRVLLAALKAKAPVGALDRAVVRRGENGETLFIPVNSMADAFGVCAALSDVPPHCAPVVASDIELQTAGGAPVTAATLLRNGIAPYSPTTSRAKVAWANFGSLKG
ncbi:MAG TPA: hypothetical protein VH000_12380 [Rhizomicrobium sp.]|nr:hypothetical protein [Rhizomicrobium sp.]